MDMVHGTCPICKGTKVDPQTPRGLTPHKCWKCNGRGTILMPSAQVEGAQIKPNPEAITDGEIVIGSLWTKVRSEDGKQANDNAVVVITDVDGMMVSFYFRSLGPGTRQKVPDFRFREMFKPGA